MKKKIKQAIAHLLKMNNTPHEIALGTAIGVFIGILPVYGFHTLLVLLAALLIKPANKIAILAGTNISLPPTVPFITWAGYEIGRLLNKGRFPPLNWTAFQTITFAKIKAIYPSLLLGSLILGFFCAIIFYFIIFFIVKNWHAKKNTKFIIPLVLFFSFYFFSLFSFGSAFEEIEPIVKNDRILIMAPHPDDENIACGGVIQRALKAGAEVKVMYLTNGDHNEFAFIVYEKRPVLSNREFIKMGELRANESRKAMAILGLDAKNMIFLGYPDYGTDTMFFSYWNSNTPFRDLLTRQSYVPYKESPSYQEPYKAEKILEDVKKVLRDYKPNKIFISHAADVNGDHWAYYCYLEVALRDLKGQLPSPKVYAYLVHATGWPMPRHHHPELDLTPSQKHFPDGLIRWKELRLTDEEIDKKYKAMLCYKSQTCVSAFYLLSFVRQNELFGDYDLIKLEPSQAKAWGSLGDVLKRPPCIHALKGADLGRGVLRKQSAKDRDVLNFLPEGERVSYAVAENCFWVRIKKPVYLKNRLSFEIYISGYSDKIPFADMPNVLVKTKYNKFTIRDMDTTKAMDTKGAAINLSSDYFIFKIPLSTLGSPNFILTYLTTNSTFLPMEYTGFRRIEIIND